MADVAVRQELAGGSLPARDIVTLLAPSGVRREDPALECDLDAGAAARLWEAMVIGRRLDRAAVALTRQGELGVYASSAGQEACQVGPVLALDAEDWMFPTYRETVAVVTRGVDPVEALALYRGSAHCGFDPRAARIAPSATPIATQALHAVGFAMAAARTGSSVAALAFLGDGATSEGDAHEALNFAGVFRAPCVFFVQNNGWAISVPIEHQAGNVVLAARGAAYGIPALRIDGNDVLATYAATRAALARARSGGGPTLIEAVTYRMEAHTTADDPSRYREAAVLDAWRQRDPLARMERYLRDAGVLDDARVASVTAEADERAARLRRALQDAAPLDPLRLFDHVYSAPTPLLERQRAQLADELSRMEP